MKGHACGILLQAFEHPIQGPPSGQHWLDQENMLGDHVLREKTRLETIHKCSVSTSSGPGQARDSKRNAGTAQRHLHKEAAYSLPVSTKTGPMDVPTQGACGPCTTHPGGSCKEQDGLHFSQGNSPRFSVSGKKQVAEKYPLTHTCTHIF